MADLSDEDLLKKAKEDYKTASDWWEENRKLWLEDVKFANGDHWPDEIKKIRSKPGSQRPCLVVDKLNQYRKQVVNDGRQNRPSIKVRPIDDGADEQASEGFQGLFRHILNRSNADEAFDTALDHAATGGFGYFRVLTEYAGENTFNQEIAVRRIRNALAVLLSPHELADGSDAEFGFIIDDVPKKTFKKRYPNAQVTDWNADGFQEGWSESETVKVCEYFYKEEIPQTLLLLEDGTSVTEEEYARTQEEGGEVKAVEDRRTIPLPVVRWCRMTGAEILERNEWLGKYIPIIPVYGDEIDIEGKVYYSGLYRRAKDPQRLYNYARSAFAERVALTPKAPWLTPVESTDDFEEWETANTGDHQRLRYKAISDDEGKPIPAPSRVSAADVPAGFAQDMQLSEHDIQGALGMYNASLGERSNEKSGRAIMARQREGDTATFHFQDNQNRAIRYLGRILLDLAPKVYDSKRVVRILGEDGTSSVAKIDPEQKQAVMKMGPVSIYNLNVGTYDVEVEAGPSYTTKRMEFVDSATQLIQGNPQIFPVIGDLLVGAMDWPNARKVADRLKLMLPPPIKEAEQAQEQGMSPEVVAIKQQAKQAIDQLQQQLQAAEQALEAAHNEAVQTRQQLDAEKASKNVDAAKVGVEGYKAETERMQAIAPAMTPGDIAAIVQQTVQAIMASPTPAMQPAPPSGGVSLSGG